MPRLFTALEVPETTGAMLALLRGGLPGARWIEPSDYHVTLCFIGDVENGLAREIAENLAGLDRPAFEATLTGLDAFGGAKPRSVHMALAPTPALMELQAAQERLLRRLGAPVEKRQFTPHVTLARLRSEATARLTADWLALRGGERPLSFPVRSFALMSSRDSVGGGPYVVEERYPLRQEGGDNDAEA